MKYQYDREFDEFMFHYPTARSKSLDLAAPLLLGIKYRVEVGVSRVHPRGADGLDFLLGEFGSRKTAAVLSNAPELGTRYGIHAGHASSHHLK